MVYHFIDQTTGGKFQLEFNSVAEADRKIEKLTGLIPQVPIQDQDEVF